jgi:hypothetical protein
MRIWVAALIIGLVAAGPPALAKHRSEIRKSAPASRVSAHRAAAKKPAANARDLAPSGTAAPVAKKAKAIGHRNARATRKHDEDSEPAALATLEHDWAGPANFPPDIGWRLIEDPATGARLGLPEKLVPRVGASRTGSRWTSAQGQIQVETFRLTEAALPALFEEEKKTSRRQVVASLLKPDSFIITGVQGLKDFVVRAEAHGGEVRGVTVLYDQATEGRMERIGAAIVGAFAGFPDPNAAPVPGMRRMVEYGTAIVVSGNGDLIAPAHLTDDCEAITVPGHGHAERVADDKTNDLALIRLYGARNLVPATLASETARVGDVTLVGIADPIAQGGGAEVFKISTHVSGEAIEPAPKLGFSGAAAIDGSGAVAGMVDLKVPAADGRAGQTAALVPAATIRAFLQAHDVAGGSTALDGAAAEQSVKRVICVRK